MIVGLDEVKVKPRQPYVETPRRNRLFGIEEVVTVYPTEEQFKYPLEYISSLNGLGSTYGMVKIVPPSSWTPKFALDIGSFKFDCRKQQLNRLSAETRTSHNWSDRMAKYHLMYHPERGPIEKYPRIAGVTVNLYVVKCLKEMDASWQTISLKLGLSSNNIPTLVRIYETLVAPFIRFCATHTRLTSAKRKREPKVDEKINNHYYHDRYDESESDPELQFEDDDARCSSCSSVVKDNDEYLSCLDCKEYVHKSCFDWDSYRAEADCSDSGVIDSFYCSRCLLTNSGFFFNQGGSYYLPEFQEMAADFRAKHISNDMDPKLAEERIELMFWQFVSDLRQNITVQYGADIPCDVKGSGFPTHTVHPYNKYSKDPWNLNNFPQLKSSLFHYLNSDISGVTVPWAYVGMIFSAFCWHAEDHYTYSINYQHFGDTKTWYCIPATHAETFEKMCKALFVNEFKIQPQMLHERASLVSPAILQHFNIPVYVADQRPGQFIITFPKVYHAGFNHGFNYNEAVNFAPPDWISFGKQAVKSYQKEKKAPLFSHDRLLIDAARINTSLEAAHWLIGHLRELLCAESRRMASTVERFDSMHIKYKRVYAKNDLSNEDNYICIVCKSFAYVSRILVDGQIYCHQHIPFMKLQEGKHDVIIDHRYTISQLQNICREVLARM